MQRIDAQIRAQPSCHLTLSFHRLQQRYSGCPGQLCQLHHKKPYHAASDNHHLVPRPDFTHIQTMQAACRRLRHGALLKRGIFPQPVDLTAIHRTVLRKAAIYGRSVSNHMLTEMCRPVSAGFTGSAVAVGINTDPVSLPAVTDGFPRPDYQT